MEQAEFLKEILPKLKREGIHTAIETCGAGPAAAYEALAKQADLWLFDLKIADNARSKQALGASADALYERMRILRRAGARVIARIPLVPGYTATKENLTALAERIKEAGIEEVHLLPFHQYGEGKYQALNRPYAFAGMAAMDEKEAEQYTPFFTDLGLRVQIGG
jgi:pyruvate formate lyase activating enzyme